MSRKKLDRNSQEYWNRRLAKEGLDVRQGLNRRLVYVGMASKVEQIKAFHDTEYKQVTPEGASPDEDEKGV